MKKKVLTYSFFLLYAINGLLAQNCNGYERGNECQLDKRVGFKIFRQSTSTEIFANEPTAFKLVLLGNREYIISFCTERKFYPVHYIITDDNSGEILYDNKEDNYIVSIGFGLERTRNITVTATALADKAKEDDKEFPVCMGLFIQYRFP